MNTYAQNREDIAIAKYFGDFKGTLLDIGANDGKTLSNSLALIEMGWCGVLVEPSPSAFSKLLKLHDENINLGLYQIALSDYDGVSIFFDSGSHLNNGDSSLLSTLNKTDVDKWKKTTEFNEIKVPVRTTKGFLSIIDNEFDFISIDAEGEDVKILQQMDLRALGCKCLIVEHNSDKATELSIRSHAEYYGLKKVLLRNAENICLTV